MSDSYRYSTIYYLRLLRSIHIDRRFSRIMKSLEGPTPNPPKPPEIISFNPYHGSFKSRRLISSFSTGTLSDDQFDFWGDYDKKYHDRKPRKMISDRIMTHVYGEMP